MSEIREGDPWPDWANCDTPDCEHKACTWSQIAYLCFPCGVQRLGLDAMVKRYDETHGGPGAWERDKAEVSHG